MADAKELYGREWSGAELVIALHAYLSHRDSPRHESAAHVVDLAACLGRTPASVVMRLENFASIDPQVKGRAGLRRGGLRCRQVFRTWSGDPEGLSKTAELLRSDRDARVPGLFEDLDVDLPRAFGGIYELYDQIGSGGFAHVFQCLHRRTGESRAIKILMPERIRDQEAFGRFRREIRILKEIRHPSVIRIYEDNLDEEQGRPAFVMDLGQCSLADYIQDARDSLAQTEVPKRPYLRTTEAAAIMHDVMMAVESIHNYRYPLVHRDINPQNILLLAANRWGLADFGLAKFLSEPSAVSTPRYVTSNRLDAGWGTEPYTAPEQYRRFSDVDRRADVYSLGILIWELFTTEGPPMQESHLGLPGPLLPVFERAHQRDREMRYPTVSELRQGFDEAVEVLSRAG